MDIGSLTGQLEIEDQLSGVVTYATNVIKTFSTEIGNMIGLTGPAGLALGAVAGVAMAAATAIASITVSIIALGNRGSDVSDVAATFEHFSGSVDVAANSLKQMQEGTKGTVTNFDLMQSASKLLAGNVKLTSDQFGTLSKAAFVLQNQGLGPTKNMLELVSQAMLTGQVRTLKRAIGIIDLEKAEKSYANTLGTHRENLTQVGRVEAARGAILDALNKKVKEAGVQQRDFGETMEATVVFVKNWGDELSKRVAESPAVMTAVHNIENAIKSAFGKDTQTVMDAAVKSIEAFAETAGKRGPEIISFIADAITETKEWFGWLEKIDKVMAFINFNPIKTGQMISGAIEGLQKPTAPTTGTAGGREGFSAEGFGLGFDTGERVPIKPPKPTIPPPGAGGGEDLFKSDTTARVEALQKAWRNAGIEAGAFAVAFRSLSKEQKADFDVQQLLIPSINKLAAAHKTLTPEMLRVRDAELSTRLAFVEKDKALLASSGLTIEQIDRMKLLGMSEADIAAQYKVSTEALGLRIAAMQKAATIEQNLASFSAALVEQQDKDRKRKEEQALASNQAIAASERELTDFMRQQSLTTTEYQIQKIDEQAAAQIAAFSATGASAQAIKDFTQLTMDLSDERVNALMVEGDALSNYSRRNLQDIADKAMRTYKAMEAAPEQYSIATRKYFKKIAEDAQNAADGVMSSWDKTYKTLSYSANILDEIPNKFAKLGSEAIRSAQNIMDAYAEGGVFGAVMAAAQEAVKWVAKLFSIGPTDYEKRVRAANAEMKTLTSEAVKAAGSMERLALNASMVGIHIKGAFDSKDPEFLKQILDEMNDKTQKLTAAMQEYGFTWEDLGAEYRGAQLADQFDVLFEKTQLLKGAGIDYSTILQRQAGDYSSLVQAAIRSGTEIPLSMQPVLQDLIDMGGLLDENGIAFTDLSDVSWAKTMTQGFEDVTAAIYELRDALVGGVGSALDDIGRRVVTPRIQPIWEGPDESARPEEQQPAYYASGGTVVPFRPRGTDTVPAMLTPGERVIPRGGSGGGTVVVELNGRWVAETVAPELPGVIKRLGIR